MRGLEEWPKPMNKGNAHCHIYAQFNCYLFLKEFGSNHVSYCFNATAKRKFVLLMPTGSFNRTCFMTVLHRCASSFRAVALYFQEYKSIGLTHNPSVWKLKDRERDKYDKHYLRLQKYRDKLTCYIRMGAIF